MAWQTRSDATQLTSVGNTFQYFDVTPQLNPGELAVCEISVTISGTTDDAEVVIEEALDQGTPKWSERRRRYFALPNGDFQSGETFHEHVTGAYKFRVGVRSAGTTDTLTADLSVKTDGVSA